MNKKNLLVLFIVSFICIIYTVNSVCYKHIDNRIDKIFINEQVKIQNAQTISTTTNKNIVLTENNKLIITLSSACICFIIIVFSKTILSSLFLAIFIIAYFIAYKLLLDNGIPTSLTSIIISIFVAKIYSITYINLFKKNIDKKIENVLSKYVSKDIKNKILNNNAIAELGGKRADITVMFADIRGFTSLSETRKAEEVSQLLNEYFTELEPIINKYGGVINKFIGDAVLVIFGEPSQDKDHAKKAVKCAYELRKKVKEIKERWITEGKPKIDIGVGINSGEAFIGNVGTSNRFEYTAIGDTVNIASRIEDYNKIYKTHILISENTYNRISEIVDVIKIREVAIKGKSKKINIYEVLRITE